jgi:tRNA (guanine-N(7)-)-methyltransferase
MRQRKLRNLDQKYEAYDDLIIEIPSDMRGRWAELSKRKMGCAEAPQIYVEIGCGKGKFISEIAEREPDHFFVAVEGNKSVMLRAMQKIRAKDLKNVIFVPEHAGDLTEWFGDEEVAGIYLNFSDPLPKNYWYKRRLTYRDRLKSYFEVMGADGRVIFKTDNTDLLNWSVLEIAAADLQIEDLTRDLHADPELNKDNIETEYEAKYSALGQTIKRVIIKRRTL